MNIYQVKKYLANKVGKRATIKYNLGRNKFESYKIKLEKLYNNVFTVIAYKPRGEEVKCFSYNDVVMRQLKIDFRE